RDDSPSEVQPRGRGRTLIRGDLRPVLLSSPAETSAALAFARLRGLVLGHGLVVVVARRLGVGLRAVSKALELEVLDGALGSGLVLREFLQEAQDPAFLRADRALRRVPVLAQI